MIEGICLAVCVNLSQNPLNVWDYGNTCLAIDKEGEQIMCKKGA